MVFRLETETRNLADLPDQFGVLVGEAVGARRIGQIGQARGDPVAARLYLGQFGFKPLQAGLEFAHLLDRFGRLFAGLLRGADLLRGLLAAGAGSLYLRKQRPAPFVQGQQFVDRVGRPPPGQRIPDPLGVGAD